jgi:hypothetical protein
MTPRIVAVAALMLCAGRASAQSAILIGIHINAWDDANGAAHDPSYRTFLVTFRDGKAQLAADIPDLIIPRRDGFWRVGSVHKGPPRDGGYQEFVYAAPVQAVPHAIGEYHPDDPSSTCSQTDQATIGFVNPDWMSVSYMHEPPCSLEIELHHRTFKFDEPEKPLDISAALGPAALDAEKKADALAKAAAELHDCPYASSPDSTNWGIEESNQLTKSSANLWILASDYSAPHACNGGNTYEIKFPIPRSIIAANYHATELASALKSTQANDPVYDAVLTPTGEFLIAFGTCCNNPIRVFKLGQQPPGVAVLSFPADVELTSGFSMVTVQWALGRYAGDWESKLKAIAVHPLPQPLLVTAAAQK